MIEVKRIFPECNADTLLVELILKRGRSAHYKGTTNVSQALKKYNNNSHSIIGLIDKDKFKNIPPYFSEFTEQVENLENDFGLILKKRPLENKYVIFICPAFEAWIWARATESNINQEEFGFNSIDDLKRVSKRNELREDPNFKKFINKVVQSDNVAISKLREWLELIQQN